MLVFIKLGGSLITDKQIENSFREAVVERLAQEIWIALSLRRDLKILVGHGSGSFGHFAARRHRTIEGVHSDEEWQAFAEVARVAAELNYLVTSVFKGVGLPVWRIQPSASALCRDFELVHLSIGPIQVALDHKLIPLLYGDVAFDEVQGGTIISTEKIFFYLARHLPVDRILLLGEVEGVYGEDRRIISEITSESYAGIQNALGGSAGVDVTGGMETKVSDMLNLVRLKPQLGIRIFNGTRENLLKETLLEQAAPGTLIRATTNYSIS